jgi:hypothetical protein
MADNFSGAADSFKKFTQRDTASAGLAAQSGLIIPQGDIGPVAGAGDIRSAAAANRAARESFQSGRAFNPEQAGKEAWNTLVQQSDYVGSNNMRRSNEAIQATFENRAANKTAADFSQYTRGVFNPNSINNRDTTIQDIASKLWKDTKDLSMQDARKQAEKLYNEQLNKNLGKDPSGGGTGPGYDNKAKKSPQEEQSNSLSEILKLVRTICNDKLPVYALS